MADVGRLREPRQGNFPNRNQGIGGGGDIQGKRSLETALKKNIDWGRIICLLEKKKDLRRNVKEGTSGRIRRRRLQEIYRVRDEQGGGQRGREKFERSEARGGKRGATQKEVQAKERQRQGTSAKFWGKET